MNKIVYLITNHFPFSNQETFLETEIKYWSDSNKKVIILPIFNHGNKRNIPDNIEVDNILCDGIQKTKKYILFFIFKTFFSKIFYKELINNYKVLLKHPFLLFKMFHQSMSVIRYSFILEKLNNLNNSIIYTYWFNISTYAAILLKNKYYGLEIKTRTHGIDLYQERHKYNYMPLKKQFKNKNYKIYSISEESKDYLINNYNYCKENIIVSRLGVEKQHILANYSSKNNEIHILSCAFCSDVKRLDKLILALKLFKNSDMNIYWTHIGDGNIYDSIKELANKELKNINNVEFNFLGNKSNEEIIKYYKENIIDVFVNTSDSEGVPVSIMEAMSYGVPIIAPNVGGIKEEIENCGILLSKFFLIEELNEAIIKNINVFKNQQFREQVQVEFLKKYDADNNYTKFIGEF